MGLVGAYLIPARAPAGRRDDDELRARRSSAPSLVADVLVLVAIFLMVTKPGA